MALAAAERGAHPCLARRCGHPDTDHVPTPELAREGELVIWCAGCARHESRNAPRPWFRHRPAGRVRHARGGRPI